MGACSSFLSSQVPVMKKVREGKTLKMGSFPPFKMQQTASQISGSLRRFTLRIRTYLGSQTRVLWAEKQSPTGQRSLTWGRHHEQIGKVRVHAVFLQLTVDEPPRIFQSFLQGCGRRGGRHCRAQQRRRHIENRRQQRPEKVKKQGERRENPRC